MYTVHKDAKNETCDTMGNEIETQIIDRNECLIDRGNHVEIRKNKLKNNF